MTVKVSLQQLQNRLSELLDEAVKKGEASILFGTGAAVGGGATPPLRRAW